MSGPHILLKGPNRHQLGYVCVFVLFEALTKTIPSKISILLRFVELKSVLFNILCAFNEWII